MANAPIVARRKINLDWITWFKGFVVHPAVSKGAARNMDFIRAQKEEDERNRLQAIAEAIAPEKLAALITSMKKILETHPVDMSRFNPFFNANRSRPEDIAQGLWVEINQLTDNALKLQLLTQFKLLENSTYSFLVDVATSLHALDPNDENYWAIERFHGEQALHFQGPLNYRTELVRSLVERYLSDGQLKEQLRTRLQEYSKESPEAPKRISQQDQESSTPRVEPYVVSILQGAFLKTFGLDGFKVSLTETTDAQGKDYSFDKSNVDSIYPHIHFSLALLTFLGFPNRVHNGKAYIDYKAFIRNLVGGWDSLNNGNSSKGYWWRSWKNYTFEGKRLWNVILLPIKLFVILPLKLVLFPLKLALNCVKLVTEFLPEVLLNSFGWVFGVASSGALRQHYESVPFSSKFIIGLLATLVAIISASIHYVARLWAFIGTALTSPEKSARMAWDYGRSLNSRFGYVFGTLGAAISIALSATLWTLLFPIAISQALVMIPSLAPIVTSILQLPLIANVINLLNGTSIAVAGILPSVFNTIAATTTAVLGITISASTVAFAAIATFVAAPVLAVASRLADELSNLWTRWKANSPLLMSSKSTPSALQSAIISMRTSKYIEVEMYTPSKNAAEHTSQYSKLVEASEAAEQGATARIPDNRPYQAQIPKTPAPALECAQPAAKRVNYN